MLLPASGLRHHEKRPGSPRLCAGTLVCRSCAPGSGGNLRGLATLGGHNGTGAHEDEQTAADRERQAIETRAAERRRCRVGADTEDPDTSRPCGRWAVLDLAVLATESARVLCADGLVRSTTDNGAVWTDVGTVDGAVALAVPAVNPAETYVARLGAPDCAGVQIQRVSPRLATSCIPASLPKGPGQIAMSLIKGGGWLAVGDTALLSTDGLVTWKVT
jgi:hypothetical protein